MEKHRCCCLCRPQQYHYCCCSGAGTQRHGRHPPQRHHLYCSIAARRNRHVKSSRSYLLYYRHRRLLVVVVAVQHGRKRRVGIVLGQAAAPWSKNFVPRASTANVILTTNKACEQGREGCIRRGAGTDTWLFASPTRNSQVGRIRDDAEPTMVDGRRSSLAFFLHWFRFNQITDLWDPRLGMALRRTIRSSKLPVLSTIVEYI